MSSICYLIASSASFCFAFSCWCDAMEGQEDIRWSSQRCYRYLGSVRVSRLPSVDFCVPWPHTLFGDPVLVVQSLHLYQQVGLFWSSSLHLEVTERLKEPLCISDLRHEFQRWAFLKTKLCKQRARLGMRWTGPLLFSGRLHWDGM